MRAYIFIYLLIQIRALQPQRNAIEFGMQREPGFFFPVGSISAPGMAAGAATLAFFGSWSVVVSLGANNSKFSKFWLRILVYIFTFKSDDISQPYFTPTESIRIHQSAKNRKYCKEKSISDINLACLQANISQQSASFSHNFNSKPFPAWLLLVFSWTKRIKNEKVKYNKPKVAWSFSILLAENTNLAIFWSIYIYIYIFIYIVKLSGFSMIFAKVWRKAAKSAP